MVWAKFDDRFVEMIEKLDMSLEARWHYIGIVTTCCRTDTWDGVLKAATARRASDVDDPDSALLELAEHDLVKLDGKSVRVTRISDFVPPPHLRDKREADKLRKRRERAHKDGDHSLCLPKYCDKAPTEGQSQEESQVTSRVTPGTGTGTGTRPGLSGVTQSDLVDVTGLETLPADVQEPDPEPQREVWGAVNYREPEPDQWDTGTDGTRTRYPSAMDELPADSWDR